MHDAVWSGRLALGLERIRGNRGTGEQARPAHARRGDAADLLKIEQNLVQTASHLGLVVRRPPAELELHEGVRLIAEINCLGLLEVAHEQPGQDK